ncbi:S-adenosylmethionine:tRNA ribosyltransferase-isomerase [hydrothermal vent metagenome]|uniref:S-adenosylmethionine:tRNA ribosyltransferase-isomerase n=1 Tax=hydrothermal vent metagenome TaxID=652676 RepID=A0A3B0RM56_9ZZZZ
MKVDDFDFDLPTENIALRPVNPRDAARLLLVTPGNGNLLSDHIVRDLPGLLNKGDILVCNDTKVIPARLRGRRIGRGTTTPAIEITLHQNLSPSSWKAFAKPGRKLKVGDNINFSLSGDVCMADNLNASVVEKGEGGEIELAFDLSGPYLETAIATHGEMPLPPYIASKRPCDERDLSDYQTMYAQHDGAVAAPTAGLHFTAQLMADLDNKGVSFEYLTLHVGAGTFLPVKADDTDDHKMHSENGILSPELADRLNEAKQQGRRIIAVGTTALRLLESAVDKNGNLQAFSGSTDIFITPGYKFGFIDALMTNFHLPRSTLFMLVQAFSGEENMRKAYSHAIENQYRFYSYGDSSLLFPKK